MRIHALERRVFGQQLLRALVADALHARDVVARITHQRLVIDKLRRRQAVFFFHFRQIIPGRLHAARVKHIDHYPAINQLQLVFITRHDHYFQIAGFFRLP